MAYKYNSALKTFEYSKKSYKIISDFLLSGDITNPDILLNVTKISKEFGKIPKDWLRSASAISFIKTLIQIKLESKNKKLLRAFTSFIKNEKLTVRRKSPNGQYVEYIDILENLNQAQLVRLMKIIGLLIIKQGGKNRQGEAIQGTWIHKDLAVEYARWLGINFSIWISQKILKLISDGVAWNEIRATTKMDYKPLILAIEKYIMPKYPNMGQKAKEIRAEKQIEDDELTRDYFKKLQLKQIEEVQVFAKTLIVQLDIYDFKTLEDKISKYKF